MEKRKTFYSCVSFKDFTVGAAHGLCKKKDYKKCCKEKKCLEWICGDTSDKLFGKCDSFKDTEEMIAKRIKKEELIRKRWFKQCLPVEFIIKRGT